MNKQISNFVLSFALLVGLISCGNDSPINSDDSHSLDVQISGSSAYCLDSAVAISSDEITQYKTQISTNSKGYKVRIQLGENNSDSGIVQLELYCGAVPMGNHGYTYGNGTVTELSGLNVAPDSSALLLSSSIQKYQLKSDSASLFLAVAHAMLDSAKDMRTQFAYLDLKSLDSALVAIAMQSNKAPAVLGQLNVSAQTIQEVGAILVQSRIITSTVLNQYIVPPSKSSSSSALSSSVAISSSVASSSSISVSSSSVAVLSPDTAGVKAFANVVQLGSAVLYFSKEYIPGVQMARFELTWAQSGKTPATSSMKGSPMARLSMFDAVLLCNALSKRDKADGLDSVYAYDAIHEIPSASGTNVESLVWLENLRIRPGVSGYRLPTVAEWKNAYYYMTGKSSGYYWGAESYTNYAQFGKACDTVSCPVGLLKPNMLGLFDMTGNVNEWVTPDNLTQLTGAYTDDAHSLDSRPFAGAILETQAEPWIDLKIDRNRVSNRGMRLVKVTVP